MQGKGSLYDGSVALIGGGGNDQLIGTIFDDELYGGAGNDTLTASLGNDKLDGGSGDDLLYAGFGDDTLIGGAGKDAFHGESGDDQLSGGDDADTLHGGAGNDTLDGGIGNDVLWGSSTGFAPDGNDSLRGGAGFDIYRASGGDTIEDADGQGMVRMRQRILEGGWREKGETLYRSWDKQFSFDWNGSTLTVTGDGDGALSIKNFANGSLGIYLSESDRELPKKPSFDPNLTLARIDPLVLDLNHDGVIQSTGLVESHVFFDFNRDGIAEKSGWIGPQDGMLVNDLNANSVVDDLGELFGSVTEDGFASLKRQFDSDGNGVIDRIDEGFGRLRVWQDHNLDGISQGGELKTLDELHIEAIHTEVIKVDIPSKDNFIIGTATFVQDGQTHLAADMALAVDYGLTDSNPVRPSGEGATLSDAVAMLPKLRGFGVVKDLAYACEDDLALLACVEALVAGGRTAVDSGFEAMVVRWSGLEAAYARQAMSWSGSLSIEDKLWILEAFGGVNVSKDLIERNRFDLQSVNRQQRLRFNETYINERFTATVLRMELSFSTQAFDMAWLKGVFYSVEQDRFDAYAPAELNDSLASRLPQLNGYEENEALARLIGRLLADGAPLDRARLGEISAATAYANLVHFALTAHFNPGTARNDWIEGQLGQSNWLDGADGHDTLIGFGGDDMLHGGAGNDRLWGGEGSDVYAFNAGDGNDVINDADDANIKGTDVIRLGAGISAQNTSVQRNGDDLVLDFGTAGSVRVSSYFYADADDGSHAIEQIVFADGTVWDIRKVKLLVLEATAQGDQIVGYAGDDVIEGLAGHDVLKGGGGNDTLHGGTGSDFLVGGDGADVFLFDRGDGQDLIREWGDDAAADTVKLGSAFGAANAVLKHKGLDLILSFAGVPYDQLTIEGYFRLPGANGNSQIERIEFSDGTVWSPEAVRQRFTGASSGDDSLYALDDTETLLGLSGNDSLHGSAFANVIVGGTGDDYLEGRRGSDTYVFARGDGKDTVYDHAEWQATEVDTLQLGTGITQAQTRASRSGQDLLLDFGQNDAVTIRQYFDRDGAGATQIERIEFSDGTVWDLASVKHRVLHGGELADTLLGHASDDLMSGGEGSDHLDGALGNDVLHGDAGDDTLIGGAGNDTLNGASGDDSLSGGGGDDVLDGGAGQDVLNGGRGNNVYLFGRGDGVDTIVGGVDLSLGKINTLQLKAGIGESDIGLRQLGHGDLEIAILGTGDKLVVQYVFDGDDPFNAKHALQRIQFADGAAWDIAAIEARLFAGTDADDLIRGTLRSDHLQGGLGDDALSGAAGDDTLVGGRGNDLLEGGPGNNRYLFERGDGADSIAASLDTTADKINVLAFGPGIAADDVRLQQQGAADLEVALSGSSDKVLVRDFFADDNPANARNGLQQIHFADGTVWGLDAITARLLAGTEGDDVLRGTVSDDLIRGGEGADRLHGAAGADALHGDGGDDWLDGGSGADHLSGGVGNDTYRVDAEEDRVEESANAGIDTVLSSARSFTLPAHTEHLILEVRPGGEHGIGIEGTGNQLDNVLRGNSFANRLDGRGGLDTLIGGAGDDVYVVDTTSDLIEEAESAGSDTVEASVSYSLAALAAVENLRLTGTGDLNATGNDLANVLRGNVGNNALDGGLGDDHMAGGAGDDTYFVDAPWSWESRTGDVVAEYAGEGLDTIVRSFDTTLILEDQVENLTLTGSVYRGNGNGLDNLITGNAADNNLLGLGGNDTLIGGEGNDALFGSEGRDLLIGGTGNDYYEVDDSGDTVVEHAGEGDDFVRASVSWSLGAHLERLALDGPEHLTAHGNALRNGLWGNSGDNLIAGGQGDDFLSGGAGNDVYLFNAGDGQDTIDNLDALGATDTLRFGAGIAPEDVLAFQSGNNLFFQRKGSSEQVAIANHYAAASTSVAQDRRIDRVEFADGTVWEQGDIQALVDRADNNHAPSVTSPLPALKASLGSEFRYVVPLNTITDPDAWDAVTYSAKMGNGDPLPSWLSFDAQTRSFSGTPTSAHTGTLQFVLWGTDSYGASTGTYVNLSVSPPNRAPVLAIALADQSVAEGAAINYTLPTGAFTDPDADDSLSYAATLSDGMALPSWLSFSPITRRFIGAVPTGALASLEVQVTATDRSGLAAQDVFKLSVAVQNLTLNGSSSSEALTGRSGDDSIDGKEGSDRLIGNAGNDRLIGGSGHDVLEGGAGHDTLIGGVGSDILIGGTGNDSYLFGRGDGIDTVQENDANVGNVDVFRFLQDITVDQVWFRRAFNHLEISLVGTSDRATIADWYLGGQHQVERFELSDGQALLASQVNNLVNAMAAFAPPPMGQTRLSTAQAQSLDTVIAASWN